VRSSLPRNSDIEHLFEAHAYDAFVQRIRR
jgi:hypothetical protein